MRLGKITLIAATAATFLLAVLSVRRLAPMAVSAFQGPPPDLRGLELCTPLESVQDRLRCFRTILEPQLEARGPRAVLQDLDRLQGEHADFRSACHDMAHVLGRHWIARGGSVAQGFAEGSNVCHSGFYHGMVERAIRGSAQDPEVEMTHVSPEELRTTVPTLCTSDALGTPSGNFRFQCLHGLGHAVVFSLGYRLPVALELCDTLPDAWSRESCYGGAVMENITGGERDRRMLRPGDAHYPCSVLAPVYRAACYGMQTSWMLEDGLSWDAIVAACRVAGAHRLACFQSLGRDVSPLVRQGDTSWGVGVCEARRADERSACIRGAVYALADHTWDGRYAYPFCAAFSRRFQDECFREAHNHLISALEQPADVLRQECASLTQGRERCEALLPGPGGSS